MTEERRQHSRIAFHSPASLEFSDHTTKVVVVDISLKGALIRLPDDTPIKVDAPCTLNVHLNEMNDQITMQTRVAHVGAGAAGLLCQTIDLDSVTHLRRLVELNLGNPELLERELSAHVAD